jgi:hypothetical protein
VAGLREGERKITVSLGKDKGLGEEPAPFSEMGGQAGLAQLKAVLLGPAASGKSSFVAALEQSVILDPGDAVDRCLPRGASAWLAQRADNAVNAGERLTEPSVEMEVFGFEVELKRPSDTVELLIHDGPGESMFSPRGGGTNLFDSTWLDEARSAQVLVLCVDAEARRRDYWRAALGQLVEDLASRRGGPRAGEARIGSLPFDRVLFLLSCIDRMCSAVLAASNGRHNGSGFLRRLSAGGPSALGRALDPAPQLRALLGAAALGRVLHAVQEGAEVAVGAVSAGGFDPTSGRGRLDEKGRGRRGGVDTFGDWCPFGVREALEFMVTGRSSGSVVSLARRDLRPRSTVRIL